MITVRDLGNVGYWAFASVLLACRFFFTSVYFLVSFSALLALLHTVKAQSSAQFHLGHFASFAFLAAGVLIPGAAGWTTLRNSRTQKIWVLLFAFGCLLVVSPWFGVPLSTRFTGAYLTILAPAFGGMLVFLLPYRLRLSLSVSSCRIDRPGQSCESPWCKARSLRSRACWAIMFLLSAGRLALIVAYWILFEHLVEASTEVFREVPYNHSVMALKVGMDLIAVGIAVIGFMAVWTVLRKSPRQRIWTVMACLAYLAVAVLFFLNQSTRHGAYARESLAIALGGMLVYLLPYRLQWSVNVFSYQLKNPEHTSRELHFSI